MFDRDRDPGRAPTHAELEQPRMNHDPKLSLVLAELWERRSAKNNMYFSGFMGSVSLALLRDGERPHPTRPGETVVVWRLLVQERGRPAPLRRSPPERDSGSGRENEPRSAGASPGGSGRPSRRESETARRERVARKVATAYGLEGDPNDPLPF